MTAAVIAPTGDEPDWPIIFRLINQRPVGARPPTRHEYVHAVWLLLDLSVEVKEIQRRMAGHLNPNQIAAISATRKTALAPVLDKDEPGARRQRNALELAPTAKLRMLLGVSGITRPGSELQLEHELSQLFDELE